MVESVLTESDYNVAVLIPVYNHKEAIGPTLGMVLEYGLPVLLVDDGSDVECRDELERLNQLYEERVSLVRLDINGGKGAAVKAGLRELLQRGYSHAVQIDADGQHDLSDLPEFIRQSKNSPETLITGYPRYDATVPSLRYYARYLTHVWVWINTLSLMIKDAMCGFRVYPLARVVNLLDREPCGNRMDFDPEVIVRWSWLGYRVINIPTRVHYPMDGVSHFMAFKDNALISKMHASLFLGMIVRLPTLLRNRR